MPCATAWHIQYVWTKLCWVTHVHNDGCGWTEYVQEAMIQTVTVWLKYSCIKIIIQFVTQWVTWTSCRRGLKNAFLYDTTFIKFLILMCLEIRSVTWVNHYFSVPLAYTHCISWHLWAQKQSRRTNLQYLPVSSLLSLAIFMGLDFACNILNGGAVLNVSFGPVYSENHPFGVHLKGFCLTVGRCCREVWRELPSGNHIICFIQQHRI